MTQFYISKVPPENDVERCHESLATQKPITISGATEKGDIALFTGVVQSVEDNGESATRSRRWRVTINEAD